MQSRLTKAQVGLHTNRHHSCATGNFPHTRPKTGRSCAASKVAGARCTPLHSAYRPCPQTFRRSMAFLGSSVGVRWPAGAGDLHLMFVLASKPVALVAGANHIGWARVIAEGYPVLSCHETGGRKWDVGTQ